MKFYANLKELYAIFARFFSKFCVTPTDQSVSAMALKFLSGICILLKVDRFEGFVNRSRNEGVMPNNTWECKLQR